MQGRDDGCAGEGPIQSTGSRDPIVLEKLAYLMASGTRERVLAGAVPSPKPPVQLAQETGLRLPHVSRALSQLRRAGLVVNLGAARRGKLYGATDLGRVVFRELSDARGDRLVAPMVRGSHFRIYHRWVTRNFGRDGADALLREVGLNPRRMDTNGWYPLRTAVRVLELIDSRFGDGSGETVRRMFREDIGSLTSVRNYVRRMLPLGLLIEMGPVLYNREFNHGRFEAQVSGRRAVIRNFDWVSAPVRCKAWLGAYEGVMILKGLSPRVRKVACILRGNPYCGYVLEW